MQKHSNVSKEFLDVIEFVLMFYIFEFEQDHRVGQKYLYYLNEPNE